MKDKITMFAHCDQRILHAPGKCKYCDEYPEWQELREAWGINFTGEYDPEKLICPAEQQRDLETIELWDGNVPRKGTPLIYEGVFQN